MKIDGHNVYPVTGGHFKCDACNGPSHRDGLICRDCKFAVHNTCAFVFSTPETHEHPSHVGHSVKLLTGGAPDHTDPKCHICGKNTQRIVYHCSKCKLSLDIDCMVEAMYPRGDLNMWWHHHPLLKHHFNCNMLCRVCGHLDGDGYFCPLCKLMVHEKCVSIFDSPEITHPFHTRHSLKLLVQGSPSYTDPKCHVCEKHTLNFLYHCDICKFNLDMACAIEYHSQHTTRQVTLSNLKIHDDTVTLIPRLISFVCDACGTIGDRFPYVSLQSDLKFFHQSCTSLPRVIYVNRHEHRVSYTYPLGPGLGERKCGICFDEIDWSYGGYSCSSCPNYVLHTTSATGSDVWDGIELDGVPEEVEDISSFKVNEDNTITHFAHEHNLSLNKDGMHLVESILCEACVRPIASDTFYNCSDCTFVLHETCAILPKKKRHFLSPNRLTLHHNSDITGVQCGACFQICGDGFMYIDEGSCNHKHFDLLCSSIDMPFNHESHPHHLLYLEIHPAAKKTCQGCLIDGTKAVLGCVKCNYFLDFHCATLPLTVKLPKYDSHPLTLCYGEKASGKYWCDICEIEINPETWFYTCNDCGVTVHVFCVVGNVRYAKPGVKICYSDSTIEGQFELMFNSSSSRPLCNKCHCRCAAPFFLIEDNNIFCSFYCLLRLSMSSVNRIVIRPPWVINPW